MRKSRLLRLILLASATSLTSCGGSGDADENVVRNLFAIGETVEALEDGEMIEGDVSENDQGEGLSYVLSGDGLSENGELTFNADGTFTYKPNANFSGTDSYQYVVN
ncbi:Ig-like domain-containing protein [Psychrosphaera algicola]|uniref:Ig-like domain-containing protein n=1 Tax=Psychrosphaera algicola TaxID=3023714 RepID=A0ABT5FJ22_9GAMM|nr:Ig-like domain-containing protein [Psychrosphaera sp. G1-22]MDC2891203.1 Ig-like domain-containing protein [Psychrosphaera sp. G1-22]